MTISVGSDAAQTPDPAHRGGTSSTPLRGRGSGLLRYIAFAVVLALVVVLVRTFVLASFYIPSGSMEPTLHGCPGCQPDLVVVNRMSYLFGSPSRGDVIVFNRPPLAPTEDKRLIKRVIGLPGETVSGHDGKVWVDGRALNEPYVDKVCDGTGDFSAVTIPAGRYWVMGDNRCNSADSRVFGTITKASIVGRAFAVAWPLKHLSTL